MKREEGEALIGKPVTAWTARRGTYFGELIEVRPSRPWRGTVRVFSVRSLPMGESVRILRPDSLIEVGGINIQPHEGAIPGWQESVEILLASEDRFLADWITKHEASNHPMHGEARGIENLRKSLANVRRQIIPCSSTEPQHSLRQTGRWCRD